jgi:transcriptional regulator with XRE-family HTH domain
VPPRERDEDLAAVLRRLRDERGLSQEAVAVKAGITVGSYARAELAKSGPAWVTVDAIAQGLGIRLSELARMVEEERGE